VGGLPIGALCGFPFNLLVGIPLCLKIAEQVAR